MSNRNAILLVVAWFVSTHVALEPAGAQTTWYVDDDAPNDPGPGDPTVGDPLEDGSAEHPFDAIQEGIDAALDGNEVMVAKGTYTGLGNRDLDLAGKAITVRSADPNDPAVVAATIIDCEGTPTDPHRGFTFRSGEGSDSVIAGLTITNGLGPKEEMYGLGATSVGGGIFCDSRCSPTIVKCTISGNSTQWWTGLGGGIYCNFSSPTISDCTITANFAGWSGGGLYGCDGPITDCTVSGNAGPWSGGGLVLCNGAISGCLIANNWAGADIYEVGGGLLGCHGPISNCVIVDNYAAFGGGGLYGCDGPITSCVIRGNVVGDVGGSRGAGLSACDGPITNCTIVDNLALLWVGHPYDSYGGGLAYCDGAITNSIIWDNYAVEAPQIYASSTPSYSCIQDWTGEGEGNIDADPLVAGPDTQDFHLASGSPCVNAGDPSFSADPNQTDIDGDKRIRHCRVDMGADESPYYRDCNENGVSDECDVDPNDPDGDGEIWQDCIPPGPNGIPDECECICDIVDTGEGAIDLADLAQLLSNYGMVTGARYEDGDLDCNGNVDLSDLAQMLSCYGTTCE